MGESAERDDDTLAVDGDCRSSAILFHNASMLSQDRYMYAYTISSWRLAVLEQLF